MQVDIWTSLLLLSAANALIMVSANIALLSRPNVERRIVAGGIAFWTVLIFWSLGEVGVHLVDDQALSFFYFVLGATGKVFFPLAWLVFALASNDLKKWLTPRSLALLTLPSVLFYIGALTNNWHQLFYIDLQYRAGSGSLRPVVGPVFLSFMLLSYTYVIAGIRVFVCRTPIFGGWNRMQRASFLTLCAACFSGNILRSLNIVESPTDILPILVIGPSWFVSAFLFRHWMVDVVRVALAQASDQMGDAVVVLDVEGRVIDANRAAMKMFSSDRSVTLGRPIQSLLGGIDSNFVSGELNSHFANLRSDEEGQFECYIEAPGTPETVFLVEGWPMRDDRDVQLGYVLTFRDRTGKRKAQRDIESSEARYRGLFENATDIVFTFDLQGYFTSINLSGQRVTGYDLSRDGTLNLAEVVAPEYREFAQRLLTERQPNPTSTNFEIEVIARDGHRLILEVNTRLMFEEGKPVEIQGIARDVTEARAITRRLAGMVTSLDALQEAALKLNSQQDLDSLMCRILEGVSELKHPDQCSIFIAASDGKTFTEKATKAAGGPIEIVKIPRTPSRSMRAVMREQQALFVGDTGNVGTRVIPGLSRHVRAYAILPLRTPNRVVGTLVATYLEPHRFSHNIQQLTQVLANHAATAIANLQIMENLKEAATADPLTALPNHRHLMDRLNEEIGRARRGGRPFAVLMLDIDGFKLINDTHGHLVGDEMLRHIAAILRGALRSSDIVGRYGGDEFLALLPDTGRDEVSDVVERILEAVRCQAFTVPGPARSKRASGAPACGPIRPGRSDGARLPIRISVGAAVYPTDSANKLELISLADAAMYASKRSGGNNLTMAHTTDSAFLAAQNATFSVLEGLVNAVDGKDHYTRMHSEQVAQLSLRLAENLEMEADMKRLLRIASLLHDVGKIGIPDHILRKPGRLTEEERETVRQHPLMSEMIMTQTSEIADVVAAVRHHHERYDGKGYPRGLRGEEIPLPARVLAIADAFSAMVSDRPYRKALPLSEAIAVLRKEAGAQFDPSLVEPFIRVVSSTPSVVSTCYDERIAVAAV